MQKASCWLLLGLLGAVVTFSHGSVNFSLKQDENGFTISIGNKMIIEHTKWKPFLFAGMGTTHFRSHLGNQKIDDYVDERISLPEFLVKKLPSEYTVKLSSPTGHQIGITLSSDDKNDVIIKFSEIRGTIDRIWMRLKAEPDEKVYGGGEQFSYFNLRGRNYPLWTGEQGVGRNKSNLVTLMTDLHSNAGGDYYSTYFPLPTFVSSRHYYCHVDSSAYIDLNFGHLDFHEVLIHNIPQAVYFNHDDTMLGLVQKLTRFLGRQPVLPEWVYSGTILGLQGGTQMMLDYLKQARDHGIHVTGLWIQDWVGRLTTSFGRRLFWNWEWNKKHYPGLDKEIARLREEGVRVLGYVTPLLNIEGNLFKEAAAQEYLVLNATGQPYITDYGEFYCGDMDLTNPKAFKWYKGIIKKNMIDLGLGGWMADFAEYLPTDGVFHSGELGTELHNKWPSIWARLNREVVEEAGKMGEIMFFMRAGYTGSQKYTLMTWAGDQNVDFTYADGLASVIPAALSFAMSGIGITHFDVGGYTALPPNPILNVSRTEELFLRYAELAVFTPVMRTHEGNRPSENWQLYSSKHTLDCYAVLVKMHKTLAPYTLAAVKENAEEGIPVQRPLFLHYDSDPHSYDVTYQYLYGRDLLVAPVHQSNHDTWSLYLPPDEWVHMFDGTRYTGPKEITVASPIGRPPVFYRASTTWKTLFNEVAAIANKHNKSSQEEHCDAKTGQCP